MSEKIAIFKGKKIRRILYNNEWYFAVVDIVEALTDSTKPRDYWYRLKKEKKRKVKLTCRQFVDN